MRRLEGLFNIAYMSSTFVHFSIVSLPSFSNQQLKDLSQNSTFDPFQLAEKDIKTLSGGIKDLLGSDHPVLESCAKFVKFYRSYYSCVYCSITTTQVFF
jgi:hypothetical protein